MFAELLPEKSTDQFFQVTIRAGTRQILDVWRRSQVFDRRSERRSLLVAVRTIRAPLPIVMRLPLGDREAVVAVSHVTAMPLKAGLQTRQLRGLRRVSALWCAAPSRAAPSEPGEPQHWQSQPEPPTTRPGHIFDRKLPHEPLRLGVRTMERARSSPRKPALGSSTIPFFLPYLRHDLV